MSERTAHEPRTRGWARYAPILRWGPTYQRSWLRRDVIAGVTVATVLIPPAIAYAGIIGIEPIVGLYTVPLALVAYAIFGGSKLLVVGPSASIAVLTGSTVAAVATGDDRLALTIALTLIVGVMYLLLAALRMGWIADLVPDPVLRAFIQGMVWVTILGQIPKLLGIELDDPPSDFWRKTVDIVRHLGDAHTETAVLGLTSLVALFLLHKFVPGIPGSLVVLLGSMAVIGWYGLAGEQISVVGEPSGGLFGFTVPTGLQRSQLVALLPGAVAIIVVGFTKSMGTAKAAARRTGERLDPNQELFATGISNLGAGLSGGYTVSGILSKTGVALASGGRTQVLNLVAAALAVLATLVLRPLFAYLANTVLAVLIISALAGTVNVRYFRKLRHISRMEFLVALLTFLGVLTFGVLPGVMVGVVLSLAQLVDHIGRPPGMVLGRTPDGTWRDVEFVEDAKQIPGLVVFRQEAPLVFLNARRTSEHLRELAVEGVEVIVTDASRTSSIDSTAFDAMVSTRDDLFAKGVELWVVNPSLRKQLERKDMAEVLGVDLPRTFATIDEAVSEFERSRRPGLRPGRQVDVSSLGIKSPGRFSKGAS